MARFDKGWFAVSRNLLPRDGKGIFYQEPELLAIWMTLLAWANIAESKALRGKEVIMVKRGEVLTSMRELGEPWNLTLGKVRRCLDILKNNASISIINNTRRLHIRIENYDKYQNPEKQNNTINNTINNIDSTSSRHHHDIDSTSSRQRIEQYKQINNSTKEQLNTLSPPLPPTGVSSESEQNLSTSDYALADRWWLELALKVKPWLAERTPNHNEAIQKFAESISECRHELKLSDAEMVAVFEFVKADKFWQELTTDPKSLMTKNTEGVRKIESIMVRMTRHARKYKAVEDWASAAEKDDKNFDIFA